MTLHTLDGSGEQHYQASLKLAILKAQLTEEAKQSLQGELLELVLQALDSGIERIDFDGWEYPRGWDKANDIIERFQSAQ